MDKQEEIKKYVKDMNLTEATILALNNKLIENKSRYNINCYNELGNLVYTKAFYNDYKKAISICKRWKDKYYFVDVVDTVIGCEYFNPYEDN